MSRMKLGRFGDIKNVLEETPVDERDTADATIGELVEEMELLVEEVVTFRTEVERLKKDRDAWKKRATTAEDELRNLRAELRNLRTELRLREGSSLHPEGGM